MNMVEDRQKKLKFAKILLLVGFWLTFFFLFNFLLTWQVLLLFIIVPLIFLLFKNELWIFLILIPPSLLLGEVINFSIKGEWVYEASLGEAFLILAVIVFSLDCFLNNCFKEIKVDKVIVILFLYLLLALFSFSYIVDFRFFIYGLKIITLSFLAYLLALNLLDQSVKVKWFLRSIMATVFFLSLQTLVKFYQMGFSSKFFFERNLIELPLGPVALTSALLAFLIPLLFALYFSLDKRMMEKWLILAIFSLGFVAVFLSLGKAAIFSLGLACFYLFIKLKEKRIVFVLFSVIFLILALVFFSSFFTGLIERISQTFVNANTQFRLLEYRVGWQIIRDNFWTGVGAGQQLAYYKAKLGWQDPQLVNNFFLQAFIDLGVLGLILVISLVLAVFRKTKLKIKEIVNNYKDSQILAYGFAASFIVAFLNGLAEVTIFALPYAIIFWLVLGTFNNIEKYA